jgi:ribosomal protein S18 acetylase RimI-like enzyme
VRHPLERLSGIHPGSPVQPSRRNLVFERGSFWEMDLANKRLASTPIDKAEAAVFSEIHRDNADTLAIAMGLTEPAPVLHRLASGKRCFAARMNGEIGVYGWVSRSVECIGEIEHEILLQPEEAYIWDCATLPQYRRLGYYTALLRFITAELQAEGIKRVWIGSSIKNVPSLRGFDRAGFRPVITIFFVRLLNLSFLWVAGDPSAPRPLVESGRQILTANWKSHWGFFVFDHSDTKALSSLSQSSCSDGTA